MKLKDLQESFDTAITDVDVEDESYNEYRYKSPSDDELGRGTFSRARSGNDPHVIKKQQMNKYDSSHSLVDLFDEYAEIISKGRLWEYIHFPRVYATKRKTDQDGNTLHDWEMERLIPSTSIDSEELKRLSQRYFVPDVVKELGEEHFHVGEFAYQLEAIIETNSINLVKDVTLAKAVTILHKIFKHLEKKSKAHHVNMDMHEDNIMFRRTQNGLQVVFSDPFVRDAY